MSTNKSQLISSKSLFNHYFNHEVWHRQALNRMCESTSFADRSLEYIVQNADGELFFHAAELWNHRFFWQCLSYESTVLNCNQFLAAIEKSFGSSEQLQKEFLAAATLIRGAGWAWIVKRSDGAIQIETTQNAATPILDVNSNPLLALDCWEHAYYENYGNDRASYVRDFWTCIDWNFVTKNFHAA